jgi:hypothetical protein
MAGLSKTRLIAIRRGMRDKTPIETKKTNGLNNELRIKRGIPREITGIESSKRPSNFNPYANYHNPHPHALVDHRIVCGFLDMVSRRYMAI